MASNLQTESIHLAMVDAHGVVATTAHNVIRDALKSNPIQILLSWYAQPKDLLVERDAFGLILWTVTDRAGVRPVVETLRQVPNHCIKVVFAAPSLSSYGGVFNEAGAQIVVTELTSLATHLRTLARKVPRQQSGTHPLTTGLIDRLPWSELD